MQTLTHWGKVQAVRVTKERPPLESLSPLLPLPPPAAGTRTHTRVCSAHAHAHMVPFSRHDLVNSLAWVNGYLNGVFCLFLSRISSQQFYKEKVYKLWLLPSEQGKAGEASTEMADCLWAWPQNGPGRTGPRPPPAGLELVAAVAAMACLSVLLPLSLPLVRSPLSIA